ncbi:hypothetical protein QTH97_06325 [Variovorax sp. J22R24]|uniref:hypothetical protein n=1 Tax=Variovorax gracilis TaxID=3053502 RepID=UPI0025791AAA|nr:hypothetical protein [Variovorax sp. J22R24]MDM0104540.1 hypothetical protein [Variovorax sp. J22R24]
MSATEAEDGRAPGDTESPAALESPAYPPFVRILAVILVVDLVGFGIWSLPALSGASWSVGSIVLFGLAAVCIAWMGYWIVYSRTRLDGDVLTQTWLWNKREDAADVAHLKLVHWRWLDRIVAPRLLVRRRNGAVTWIHSADARLLTGFAERVAARSFPNAKP